MVLLDESYHLAPGSRPNGTDAATVLGPIASMAASRETAAFLIASDRARRPSTREFEQLLVARMAADRVEIGIVLKPQFLVWPCKQQTFL